MPTTNTRRDGRTGRRYASPEQYAQTRDLILSLRAQGMNYAAIARHLNATSFPTITGVGSWAGSTVRLFADVPLPQRVLDRLPAEAAAAAPVVDGYLPHGRTFGVEIEYSGRTSPHSVRRAMELSPDLQVTGDVVYSHAVTPAWRVTTDATCGGEVVSPILSGQNGLDQIRSAMRIMSAGGCGTGTSASVHTHVSVLDFDQAAILRLLDTLRHADLALTSYVAVSRLGNRWCPPMTSYDWRNLEDRAARAGLLPKNGTPNEAHAVLARHRENGSSVTRYRRYNWNAVLVYGTVEFRAHGATLNIQKIRPWIAVTTALVEFAKQGFSFTSEQTVGSMLTALVDAGVLSARAAREFRQGVAAREARLSGQRLRSIPRHIVADLTAVAA